MVKGFIAFHTQNLTNDFTKKASVITTGAGPLQLHSVPHSHLWSCVLTLLSPLFLILATLISLWDLLQEFLEMFFDKISTWFIFLFASDSIYFIRDLSDHFITGNKNIQVCRNSTLFPILVSPTHLRSPNTLYYILFVFILCLWQINVMRMRAMLNSFIKN